MRGDSAGDGDSGLLADDATILPDGTAPDDDARQRDVKFHAMSHLYRQVCHFAVRYREYILNILQASLDSAAENLVPHRPYNLLAVGEDATRDVDLETWTRS